MRAKPRQSTLSLSLVALSLAAHGQATPLFRNPAQLRLTRVNHLASQLSLEKKARQMPDQRPAISCLGIPAYSWWNEALPGGGRSAPTTVFPQAIGLGATFDDAPALREATASSEEARAEGSERPGHGVGGRRLALGPQPGAGGGPTSFGAIDC